MLHEHKQLDKVDIETNEPLQKTTEIYGPQLPLMQTQLAQDVACRLKELPAQDAIRATGKFYDFLAEIAPRLDAESQISELKEKLSESKELEQLYQEQEAEARTELNNLKGQLIAISDKLAHKEAELSEISNRLAQATAQLEVHADTQSLTDENYLFKHLEAIDSIPYTKQGLADFLTNIFEDRILWTDNGKATLIKFINAQAKAGNPDRIAECWQLVRALALAAYPLWFSEREDNMRGREEELFHDTSGFELSLHETKDTMSNPDLRKLRTCVIDGKEYVSGTHIRGRIGGARHSTRIYFVTETEIGKIAIYHFGEHLDTIRVTKSKRP